MLLVFHARTTPVVGTRHNRQLHLKILSYNNSVKLCLDAASSPKSSSNVLICFCGAIRMVGGGMDCGVGVVEQYKMSPRMLCLS